MIEHSSNTMPNPELPINQVLIGNCIEILNTLPENSIDLVFADPPYNLQLQHDLWRPNNTKVAAVDENWDRFDSNQAYDDFTTQWLKGCHRVLKDDATLWVIGTYHNIFRIGSIMQDLGFWILNDVIWVKLNPMPNFRGVRLTNAHETLIWACKNKRTRYTFNYHSLKTLNDDLQMRSDWFLPICTGTERIKVNGKKAHPTQKPESLLYRVLLASTRVGDVVLDPFFGTGTTGAVSKRLRRFYIGIEQDPTYAKLAEERISKVEIGSSDENTFHIIQSSRRGPKLTIGFLLENGFLIPGQTLFFKGDRKYPAQLRSDGNLHLEQYTGSIHQAGKKMLDGLPCNGWEMWYYEDKDGKLNPIDKLRQLIRSTMQKGSIDSGS